MSNDPTLRSLKGSELSHAELDANFSALDARVDALEVEPADSATIAAGAVLPKHIVGAAGTPSSSAGGVAEISPGDDVDFYSVTDGTVSTIKVLTPAASRNLAILNATGNTVTVVDAADATIRAGVPNRHVVTLARVSGAWTFKAEFATRLHQHGTADLADNAITTPKLADMAAGTFLMRAAGAGTGDPIHGSAAQARTALNVEDGATADQSASEIEAAYDAQVAAASQAEAEAGSEAAIRRFSPLRIGQAITAALAAIATRLLPAGGSTGQVLKKSSGTDYDVGWAADLTAEEGSPSSAAEVTFTPAGGLAATDVQAALEELDGEKATAAQGALADSAVQPADLGELASENEADLAAATADFRGSGAETLAAAFAAVAGAGSLPVDDTTALVRDPADTTKLVRLDAGALATATTRVVTLGNRDVDLAAGGTFAELAHSHGLAAVTDAGALAARDDVDGLAIDMAGQQLSRSHLKAYRETVATPLVVIDEPAGAYAIWRCDEGAGSTAADAIGALDGTLAGGASWSAPGRVGAAALELDGVDGLVSLGNIDAPAGSELTITCWVRCDSLPAGEYPRILAKAASAATEDQWWVVAVRADDGALAFSLQTDATTVLFSSAGAIAAGDGWHHVACRYDGADMTIWADGELVGTTGKSGTVATDAGVAAAIGGDPGAFGNASWAGAVNRVEIFGRALSDAEIADEAGGAKLVLDCDAANVFSLRQVGGALLTFTSPPAAGVAVALGLFLEQDSIGGHLLGWPGSLVWVRLPQATVPAQPTAPGARATYTFVTLDGGVTWLGF